MSNQTRPRSPVRILIAMPDSAKTNRVKAGKLSPASMSLKTILNDGMTFTWMMIGTAMANGVTVKTSMIRSENQPGEGRQTLSCNHVIKDHLERRHDLYLDDDWHSDGEWGHGKNQHDQVVQRPADLRNAVVQKLAAGGQHLGDIADALARGEHRSDLRRQQAWHLIERLTEPHSCFQMRRHEMEACA